MTMQNIKLVAIRVYELSKADRSWLLSQLTDEERANLEIALKELEESGLTKALSFEEVMESLPSDDDSSEEDKPRLYQDAALYSVLREIPDYMVAEWARNNAWFDLSERKEELGEARVGQCESLKQAYDQRPSALVREELNRIVERHAAERS